MTTTLDRFQGATLSLAGSAHIKERITDAYRNHLALVAEDELPVEVRIEFRALSVELTRDPPLLRGEDAFRATVRKMSCDEAEAAARRVVRMFVLLSLTQNAVRPKPKTASNVVPLYLAEA